MIPWYGLNIFHVTTCMYQYMHVCINPLFATVWEFKCLCIWAWLPPTLDPQQDKSKTMSHQQVTCGMMLCGKSPAVWGEEKTQTRCNLRTKSQLFPCKTKGSGTQITCLNATALLPLRVERTERERERRATGVARGPSRAERLRARNLNLWIIGFSDLLG